MNEEIKVARTLTGRVASAKMDRTITVVVDRLVRHPVYAKYVRRSSKFHAHDENNECRQGDLVSIQPCRPLAKTKSWRLVKVLEKAQ